MATLEERRHKDGTVTYRVKVRRKGYRTLSRTFKQKTRAKQFIRKIESDIDQGSHSTNTEASKRSLAEAIDRYSQFTLPKKPKSQNQQTMQLSWWKQQIGDLKLAQVTPAVLSESRTLLAHEQTNKGIPRSDSTVNRYMAVISHLFTIAMKEWGWINSNPCRRLSKLTEPRGRVRFLDHAEIEKLMEACKNSPNEYLYIIVVIALSTGARRNEIMTLTRDDVDLSQNILIFRDTKNTSTRSVPLLGEARELVDKLLKVPKLHTKLLFPSKIKPEKPYDIRKAWENALRTAQIDQFRFHDLRHTAASYLTMSGASLIEVAEILGHRTLNMVQRYSHLNKKHLDSVIERMNKHIFMK
jgi:integrase